MDWHLKENVTLEDLEMTLDESTQWLYEVAETLFNTLCDYRLHHHFMLHIQNVRDLQHKDQMKLELVGGGK